MLWDNCLTMLCAAILGGFVGAFFAFAAMKGNRRQNMQMLEIYWNEDVKKLNLRMDSLINECITRNVSLYQELSPKAVHKAVWNHS